MIIQNIFIINLNSLYEILNEIKDNLPFKIVKYDNEEDIIRNRLKVYHETTEPVIHFYRNKVQMKQQNLKLKNKN